MTVPRAFDLGFWVVSFLLFVVVLVRSSLIPFSHDEAATFYFYIQPGSFIPFEAHPDANGHFLTSCLGWVCSRLFGSSPFSLRLPSLLSFVLLCYAVKRFWVFFKSKQVRLLFTGSILLVNTFISYFSLCRGYGISMACLLMALFYFFSYMGNDKQRHFLKFVFLLQLALAANLTLLSVSGVCSLFCLVVQLKRRRFFRFPVIAAWVIHVSLLLYWTAYAVFLKDHGALYYGAGESYWEVTFRSLIQNLFIDNLLTEILFLCLFGGACAFVLVRALKTKVIINRTGLAFLLFTSLLIFYFLLKKCLGINYPEDRTGLFFYLLFVCLTCFCLDEVKFPRWLVVIPVLSVFLFTGCRRFAISTHPWPFYETMPARFFHELVREQSSQSERITIAGEHVREFFYGFLNFRSNVKLNHITSPMALAMNCDFALAVKADKPWYDKYYEEIDSEDRFGFRLIKRRRPILRVPVLTSSRTLLFEGENEYYNCFEIKDTIFKEGVPLQADVNFDVLRSEVPVQSWFVLQAEGENEDDNIFVRVPLDLIYGDWNKAGNFTLSLVTPNMPKAVKRIVLYYWNINKQPIKIRVNNYRLRRLEGEGITEISKAKL
jgi:hypothetical protein